jgi:hypothetical protein
MLVPVHQWGEAKNPPRMLALDIIMEACVTLPTKALVVPIRGGVNPGQKMTRGCFVALRVG